MVHHVRERLMVSHPASGFGIYLPKEAVEILGGIDTPVAVTTTQQENHNLFFKIRASPKGKLHVRSVGRSTLGARVFWNLKVPTPVDVHFAPQYLQWHQYGDDCISFELPPLGELKRAQTKSRAETKKPLFKFKSHREVRLQSKLTELKGLLKKVDKLQNDPEVQRILKDMDA